jgi:hypothetical protein
MPNSVGLVSAAIEDLIAYLQLRCSGTLHPTPAKTSRTVSNYYPVGRAENYFVSTWMTWISGICEFQFVGIASKIRRKSRSSPGCKGAAPTGWVSI